MKKVRRPRLKVPGMWTPTYWTIHPYPLLADYQWMIHSDATTVQKSCPDRLSPNSWPTKLWGRYKEFKPPSLGYSVRHYRIFQARVLEWGAVAFSDVLYSRFLLFIWFIHSINSVYMSIPISQFIPPLPTPFLGIHTFFLYICVSVSALQIR